MKRNYIIVTFINIALYVQKTLRGKYMYRFYMARGINKQNICPLMIELLSKGAIFEKVKPKLIGHNIDKKYDQLYYYLKQVC